MGACTFTMTSKPLRMRGIGGSGPVEVMGEGAPYSQTDRNEDVDGFGMRYINAKILQAGPAESLDNILGDPGCHLG